jgi:hypothetical protein
VIRRDLAIYGGRIFLNGRPERRHAGGLRPVIGRMASVRKLHVPRSLEDVFDDMLEAIRARYLTDSLE